VTRAAEAVASPAGSFVEVDGLRLRYSIEGQGPPLLLVSGIGANLDMWLPFRDQLSDFETIAMDLPGTGESATPRLPMSMRGLARLTLHLLDVLGYRRTHVLGYSFGGLLAQQIAHLAPDRVDRLVLAATGCGVGAVPGGWRAMLTLATPSRYYSRSFLEHHGAELYGGRSRREPGVLEGLAPARLRRPPTPRGYLWQLYAVSGWTSLPWLRRLRQPTLVLAGDADPVVPVVNGRTLARLIPDSRLHVVRGGGHLLLLDQPDDVVPVVRRFLKDDDAAP
jgi:poly(3-hydroxyoctanoate) depolymerase